MKKVLGEVYSNTDLAHNNFINWIKCELKNNNKNTDVIFHSVKLSHLNDTEGIYDIAVKALDFLQNSYIPQRAKKD